MAVQCNKKNSLGWRWLQVSRGLQLGHKDLDGDELLHEAIRSLNEFGLFFFFFAKPGGLIRPTDSLHRPDPGDYCTGLALLMLLCCPSGWNRFQKHSSICLCFCPVSLRPLRPVRQLVCRRTWWSFPIPPALQFPFSPSPCPCQHPRTFSFGGFSADQFIALVYFVCLFFRFLFSVASKPTQKLSSFFSGLFSGMASNFHTSFFSG